MPADFDQIAREITPEQLAEAIGAERVGRKWRCPLKDHHKNSDKHPSFSPWREDGRTVAKCHRGTCPLGEKMSAVQVAARAWGVDLPMAGTRLAEIFGISCTPVKREIEATYDYLDEAGDPLFQVVRYRPKSFRQRLPDGTWKLGDVRRVLYRLPEVLQAIGDSETVYVVEGEKDVHAIENVGGVATTAPGGAGRWRPEFSETLAGARVVIVADQDDAGRAHAWSVAGALEGIAASVRVVGAKEGKDAADHLDAGHGLNDFEPVPPATVEVSHALLHDPRLTGTAKLTYIAIAALTYDGAGISRDEIARVVGASPKGAVDTARKLLRKVGWIRWTRHRRTPCRYTLRHAPTILYSTSEGTQEPENLESASEGNQEDSASGDSHESLDSASAGNQEILSPRQMVPGVYSSERGRAEDAHAHAHARTHEEDSQESVPGRSQESPPQDSALAGNQESPPHDDAPLGPQCAVCGRTDSLADGLCQNCQEMVDRDGAP